MPQLFHLRQKFFVWMDTGKSKRPPLNWEHKNKLTTSHIPNFPHLSPVTAITLLSEGCTAMEKVRSGTTLATRSAVSLVLAMLAAYLYKKSEDTGLNHNE